MSSSLLFVSRYLWRQSADSSLSLVCFGRKLYVTLCSSEFVPRDIQPSPHCPCRLVRAGVKHCRPLPVPWCVSSPRCFYATLTDPPQSTGTSTGTITATHLARQPHHRRSLRVSALRVKDTPLKSLLRVTSLQAMLASGRTPTRRFTVILLPLGLRLFRRRRKLHAHARLRLREAREASRIVRAHAPRSKKLITKAPCTTPPSAMAPKRPRERHCSLRMHRSTPSHRMRIATTAMAGAAMDIRTGR